MVVYLLALKLLKIRSVEEVLRIPREFSGQGNRQLPSCTTNSSAEFYFALLFSHESLIPAAPVFWAPGDTHSIAF